MAYGVVYVITNDRMGSGVFKVGHTTRSVEERLAELNSETSLLGRFRMVALFPVTNAEEAEVACHSALAAFRLQANREFFETDLGHLLKIVEHTVRRYEPKKVLPSFATASPEAEDNDYDTAKVLLRRLNTVLSSRDEESCKKVASIEASIENAVKSGLQLRAKLCTELKHLEGSAPIKVLPFSKNPTTASIDTNMFDDDFVPIVSVRLYGTQPLRRYLPWHTKASEYSESLPQPSDPASASPSEDYPFTPIIRDDNRIADLFVALTLARPDEDYEWLAPDRSSDEMYFFRIVGVRHLYKYADSGAAKYIKSATMTDELPSAEIAGELFGDAVVLSLAEKCESSRICPHPTTMEANKIGCSRKQLRLYKTMLGDPSCSIPGVDGFDRMSWLGLASACKDKLTSYADGAENVDLSTVWLPKKAHEWLVSAEGKRAFRDAWESFEIYTVPGEEAESWLDAEGNFLFSPDLDFIFN